MASVTKSWGRAIQLLAPWEVKLESIKLGTLNREEVHMEGSDILRKFRNGRRCGRQKHNEYSRRRILKIDLVIGEPSGGSGVLGIEGGGIHKVGYY